MPQQRIKLKPELTYHIWTHANGDENLFRTEQNYRYFLKKYRHYITPVALTFAYCLMPNHLHFMIRVKEEKEVLDYVRSNKKDPTLQGLETLGGFSNVISRQFSHLFNGYTQAFNKKYDRKGSLFTPNFNRKLIDSDTYFVRLIAYIHNNPVYHGFVSSPDDWMFSSWHAYLTDKKTNLDKEEALTWFGTPKNFMAIHSELKMEKLFEAFE